MSLGGYVTPSSQCDNIERFCLDLIALAELLLVISSSWRHIHISNK